jgi:hypothetical protein
MLTNTRNKQSWERFLPVGERMYAGLTSVYWRACDSKQAGAERFLYADFLEEAKLILDKPQLSEVAQQFRKSGQAWEEFKTALLPNEFPLLKETRDLLDEHEKLFVEQGSEAEAKLREINARLDAIKAEVKVNFPLNEHEVVALRNDLSERLLHIRDIEKVAIENLQTMMS